MKKERILSYVMSQKLGEVDLQDVSAASGTTQATAHLTHGPGGSTDTGTDIAVD